MTLTFTDIPANQILEELLKRGVEKTQHITITIETLTENGFTQAEEQEILRASQEDDEIAFSNADEAIAYLETLQKQ